MQVVEQKPVARWGEGGLVNTRGELFVQGAQHIPAELPELVGPAGHEVEMTNRCLAAQARLSQSGLRLARMTLDERGAWTLALDNGVVLRLGRQSVDERFDRFVQQDGCVRPCACGHQKTKLLIASGIGLCLTADSCAA